MSVAEEMIQTLGYNVLTAANGQAAIATYEAEKTRSVWWCWI
ncbi:MAG: hypothetical protein R2875_06155 [Desulfobacterales bacterium]